jgi:hypothetical protein
VSDRLIGGVPPRDMPQDYYERIVPQSPLVLPAGVRPSGPPVPSRRSTGEEPPAAVTVITNIPPPGPASDEHEPNT